MSHSGGATRKQFRRNDGVGSKRRPRRGGPGMLLTCETGREQKCKREGLEILQYYLKDPESSGAAKDAETSSSKLSLDEELRQLKAIRSSGQLGEPSNEKPFAVYTTSCRGTIFFMCALPNCALIPLIPVPSLDEDEDNAAVGQKRKADNDTGDEPSQRQRTGKQEEERSISVAGTDRTGQESNIQIELQTPPWDPVRTVDRVLDDLRLGSTTAPSSRFVTRMIPIQATCFATIEEVQLTARALITKYLKQAKPATFAITLKRRHCSNLSRDRIIDTIVGEVDSLPEGPKWTVDLKNAAYTIYVEIVQTLCGMSVIQNARSYRNFNLLEMREACNNATNTE